MRVCEQNSLSCPYHQEQMTGGCPVSELCKYYTEPWWNKSTTASSTSVTYNIPSTIVATFNVIKKEKEN